MMQNDSGATPDKLTNLIDELGIAVEDWRRWVVEFGVDVVTAGVEAFDWDSLPFVGGFDG